MADLNAQFDELYHLVQLSQSNKAVQLKYLNDNYYILQLFVVSVVKSLQKDIYKLDMSKGISDYDHTLLMMQVDTLDDVVEMIEKEDKIQFIRNFDYIVKELNNVKEDIEKVKKDINQ